MLIVQNADYGYTLSESAVLPSLGVPYRVQWQLKVEGKVSQPAVLTIRPGITVHFQGALNSFGMIIGANASLKVEGTLASPVRMAPFAADQYWVGLRIAADAQFSTLSLEHLIVERAGMKDNFAGFLMTASIGIRKVDGGVFSSVQVRSPAPNSSDLLYLDALGCPQNSDPTLETPSGGSICASNGGIDCCQ